MGIWLAILLLLYNNLIIFTPEPIHDQLYVPLNLTLAALLVLWARRAGFSWQSLGLILGRPGPALRWGIGLGVVLPMPIFLGLVLPEPVDSLAEARNYGEIAWTGLVFQSMLRIPLGTVVLEEIAFRGVLYGILLDRLGVRGAFIWSSIIFGLWHIAPTVEPLQGSDLVENDIVLGLAVLGGLVVAALGGLFFCWVRFRTGSIYGPALTHWLVNGLGAVGAFIATR